MTLIACLSLILVLIASDQWIKFWAFNALRPVGSIPVIQNVLNWTYVENRGAAFGIFAGKRWLLLGATLLVVGFIIYMLVSKKFATKMEQLSACLIVAGGLGNFIDRALRGFVIDYIDINPVFSYPMFNLADCCVVIGAILMVVAVFIQEDKARREGNKNNGKDAADHNA